MTATKPAEETSSAPEPTGSQPPTWLPMAAVGVTLLLWASAFVAIRHLAGNFSPGSLSLGRLLVGSVCLGAVALSRGLPRPTLSQWVSIVTIGVLWFGVYNVALNAGEEDVDAGTAVIGNTPLVRINRIIDTAGSGTTVAAKLEFYNPANSVKDRIGVSIVNAAEASGQLAPGAITK